jgi:chloramphenicol O-acetyltransferase type A
MTQQENLFTFCTAEYYKAYADFRPHADTAISAAKQKVDLEESPERDDLIYVTSIPWISFTSLMNPVPLRPIDSFPRIAWGKYFEENGRIKLPLHLQVHHGLMDGFHAGQFFNALQEMCDHPEKFLE